MGALTSKTYAFTGRAWENNSFESLDILNGFCSNIIVESRGVSVMRILPKYSREYSAWLPDRIRVIYDAFNYNKVSTPYIKYGKSYETLSWSQASNILLVSMIYLQSKNLAQLGFSFNENYKLFQFKLELLRLLRNFGFACFKGKKYKFFLN